MNQVTLSETLIDLQTSPKGKLVYYATRVPSSPKLKRHQKRSVDLSCIRRYIEDCEKEAHEQENEYLMKHNLPRKETLMKHNKVPLQSEVQTTSSEVDDHYTALMQQLTLACEVERQSIVQTKVEAFKDWEQQAHRISAERLQSLQNKGREKHVKLSQKINVFIEASKRSHLEIKEANAEQQEHRVMTLKTKLHEAEKRRKVKVQQAKERFTFAEDVFEQCLCFYKKIEDMLKSTPEVEGKSAWQPLKNTMNENFAALTTYFSECQNNQTMKELELQEFLGISQAFQAHCSIVLKFLVDYKAEEEKKKQFDQDTAQLNVPAAKEEVESNRVELNSENEDPELSFPPVKEELVGSISRSAYNRFVELSSLTDQHEKVVKALSSSKQNQNLVMGINNSISITISSISTRSGSDIKSKLSDLIDLLKGQKVKFKNQFVSVTDHSDGLHFAYYCMAKKFVTQGQTQVASNPSNAFSFALTIIGVWEKYAVVGNLFLGLLQSKCPFIVPRTILKTAGFSELQHKRLCGYNCKNDGSVEDQDQYLKRMSGFVRIYAAILQSPLPPGAMQHPHGIEEAWKWLTRFLNLKPEPEITATVLYDFLAVVSHKMNEVYGKQFDKLMYALCHDYFPKIKEVELATDSKKSIGGPLVRLEKFLKDCLVIKPIAKPDGYLSSAFWNTYHHTDLVGN